MNTKIEYADLTTDQKNRLLIKSANLLREITEIWGAEQGMLLWEKVGEGLGQDLKGALFFSMITGNFLGDITVSSIDRNFAVPIIKTIRKATGFGLKDAKDLYDVVRDGRSIKIEVKPEERQMIVEEFKAHGCTVS